MHTTKKHIKTQYQKNKNAAVGSTCTCPSCGTAFVKRYYQQAFCQTKHGTSCKDAYWNWVIPSKRNNMTRISPANAAWRERNIVDIHPFSSEGLGQWPDIW